MFCKNCGNSMVPNAAVCVNCGVPTGVGNNFCPGCGAATSPGAVVCTTCGIMLKNGYQQQQQPAAKSKVAAGLLGIFLGAYGVHNFYLGYMNKAIIQLAVTLACIIFSCCLFLLPPLALLFWMGAFGMGIWGLIEGIMILAGSINVDGRGQLLR